MTFNATHRCDRCGSRAYMSATVAAGELLFCGHHGRKHLPALMESGATIHDETDRLYAEATTSSTGEDHA